MNRVYERINWENSPSVETPINEKNLNKMDLAIYELDGRVIDSDSRISSQGIAKADKTELIDLVKDWSLDEETGLITITKYDGSKITFDLNIEKIPVKFSLSSDGILTMTTDDGTKFTADIGSIIPIYTFEDSETIGVTIEKTSYDSIHSFFIKDCSINESKLESNFLAEIKGYAEKAESSATASAKSEINAKTSEQNTKESEQNAQNSEANAKTSEINAKASENLSATSESNAKNSEANAKASENASLKSEQSAKLSEDNAKESANTSKSYAVGGTGTRSGEDMDNSKYYSEISKSYSDTALQYSQAASSTFDEVKEKLGIAEFNVNENGYLIYTDNTSYNFTVDDNGYLNWEVA